MTTTNLGSQAPDQHLPFGDHPIGTKTEDLLGRAGLATSVARLVSTQSADHGLVIGITGPWGSGKTSLMNLVAEHLAADERVVGIVRFNPWLVAGAEQLTAALIGELSKQLSEAHGRTDHVRQKLGELTGKLSSYAQRLEPLRVFPGVGETVAVGAAALKVANAVAIGETPSLEKQRAGLESTLDDLDARVVVLIDDIDRLEPDQITDMLRAVRLAGSFPNVVYILGLDEAIVGRALDRPGFDGAAYLQKILTVTCPVPVAAPWQLDRLFVEPLSGLLAGTEMGLDSDRWPRTYEQVIRPLLRTLRDVKRVHATLPLTVQALGDELDLGDVIAMESVRLLSPNVHARIEAHQDLLTASRAPGAVAEPSPELQEFLGVDPLEQRIARGLINALFPNAAPRSRWLEERSKPARITTAAGLRYYLMHELVPGVAPSRVMAKVYEGLAHPTLLESALAGINDDVLVDALNQLEATVSRHARGHELAVASELLRLLPRIGEEHRGLFFVPQSATLRRSLSELVQAAEGEVLEAWVIDQMSSLPHLGTAWFLYDLVGRVGGGSKEYLSEEGDKRCLETIRERVERDPSELLSVSDVLHMIFKVYEPPMDASEPPVPQMLEPQIAMWIIRGALAEARRGNSLSDDMEILYGLQWEGLLAVLGGQDHLRQVLPKLSPGADPRAQSAKDLLALYLDGRRPAGFGPDGW